MTRDKVGDPRAHAREALDSTRGNAQFRAAIWAFIYQGDALHRLAKAVEAASGEEPERYRSSE